MKGLVPLPPRVQKCQIDGIYRTRDNVISYQSDLVACSPGRGSCY